MQKDKKIIIIYGPPGAGKDTQADKVAEKYGFYHLKTGNLVRSKINNPSLANDLWIQKQKMVYDSGGICDSEWVTDLVEEELNEKIKNFPGVILNGFPRVLEQAQKVISILKLLFDKENIIVLEIKIKPETTIFRNTHRRICEKCGYNPVYIPGAENLEKCPVCGGPIITRVDDKEEVIKVRLEEYEKHTRPIFDYLRGKGYQITEIDGEPDPDDVTSQIFKALEEKI